LEPRDDKLHTLVNSKAVKPTLAILGCLKIMRIDLEFKWTVVDEIRKVEDLTGLCDRRGKREIFNGGVGGGSDGRQISNGGRRSRGA
jgi:hypothetical protein